MKFARDDARQRITVIESGKVSMLDVLSIIERHYGEATSRYALLADFRGASTTLTSPDIRSMANRMANLGAAERGPVAVVATDPALFAVAHLYEQLTENVGVRFRAFHDIAAAEAWLEQHRSRSTE